jgi:hypothetical protein
MADIDAGVKAESGIPISPRVGGWAPGCLGKGAETQGMGRQIRVHRDARKCRMAGKARVVPRQGRRSEASGTMVSE